MFENLNEYSLFDHIKQTIAWSSTSQMSGSSARLLDELRFKPGILDDFFSAVDSITNPSGVTLVKLRGSGVAFKPIEKEAETKACMEFLSTVKDAVNLFKALIKKSKSDESENHNTHPAMQEVLRVLCICPHKDNGEYFVVCSTVRDRGGFVFYTTCEDESVVIMLPQYVTSDQTRSIFTDYIAPRAKKCEHDRVCVHCGSFLLKTRRCGRCMVRMFCSAECQKADWVKHKSDCCEKS